MNSATPTFGTSLKVARELAGLTLEQVGRRIECPWRYIDDLERDRVVTPEPYILWKLAPIYGLDYKALMIACGNLIVRPKSAITATQNDVSDGDRGEPCCHDE